MIGFAISALVMLVAALALLVPPLARSRRPQGPSRKDVSVATYRERLADLEAQRDAGTLDENGFAQARTELGRRLLDEQGDATEDASAGGHQYPYRAAVIAVLIPMVETNR